MPTLRSIHAVCANGDALQQIQSFLGDRAIELPVGLNHSLFTPGAASNRSRIGFSAEHKILGYVGRLSRIKGVDILAQAFRELSRTHPHVRLLLVGTGEEEPNLRALLRSESSRGLVHFAGDVSHEELPAWYRAMDILVMPSRYENYSNAVLEALACGIPFIGSDVGGNRALFQTGAAWLFEPSSPASLATTMDLALADLQVVRSRGAIGRKHVEGRYDWSATARRFEEIVLGLHVRPS
jgi:glycosyltransferase involved in cell wall biosynthesis